MQVTYRMKDLASIAAHFDGLAKRERDGISDYSSKKDAQSRRERAAVWESVADFLRNTVLDEAA